MNFQFYVEKLYDSVSFEKFKKEHPDAFPCSGFFVIDRENLKNPDNKQHIDYFDPSSKKMFSFQFEEGVVAVPIENPGDKVPLKIAMNYDFDFEEVEEIILKKMKEEDIKEKLQKTLLSFQRLGDKDYLIGTVFISKMGILTIKIELPDLNVLEFEKKSFFDMINIFKKK
jgi:hypothetical protein|tara:strand:+ start:202 stop:711 length:510 start_codon:yes stop_codon:yes gene_type:complete